MARRAERAAVAAAPAQLDSDGWFDATIPMATGTPPWPGDEPMACGWTLRIADGASVNLGHFSGSPHVGTHADAPLHVMDGACASDALPVTPFCGPACVVDVRDLRGEIDLATITPRLPDAPCLRLLLRTGASVAGGTFPSTWAYLAPAAITALGAQGLLLLGTDAPSVDDRDSKTLDAHHAVFQSGAWLMENMDLRDVTSGRYELRALPMRVNGLDAAPVRALLRVRS